MIKQMTKLTGWTASLVALAATASADVKINDYLSLNGYAVATGFYTDTDAGTTKELFNSGKSNFDSVKIALLGKYDDFTSKTSLFYVPNVAGVSESGLLDAYVTYTKGAVAVTGGKYLSYLGYEAWDPINMSTISYGNSWNPIPGYHTGVKVDYTGKGFTLGFSATDSLYMDARHFAGGDGNFGNGLGYELAATYTGIDKLTVFVGAGMEDSQGNPDVYVYDTWVSYLVTPKLTIAGEYSYKDSGVGPNETADYWAAFATYAFTDAVSVTGRVSGIIDDEPATYLTIAPTYTFNANFSVRAEVSYADSRQSGAIQAPGDKGFLYAIQGLFKF